MCVFFSGLNIWFYILIYKHEKTLRFGPSPKSPRAGWILGTFLGSRAWHPILALTWMLQAGHELKCSIELWSLWSATGRVLVPGRDFYFVVDRWRSPWDWATRTGRTSTSASASLAFEARASSPRNQVITNNKIYRCTYNKNMIHGTTVWYPCVTRLVLVSI